MLVHEEGQTKLKNCFYHGLSPFHLVLVVIILHYHIFVTKVVTLEAKYSTLYCLDL